MCLVLGCDACCFPGGTADRFGAFRFLGLLNVLVNVLVLFISNRLPGLNSGLLSFEYVLVHDLLQKLGFSVCSEY